MPIFILNNYVYSFARLQCNIKKHNRIPNHIAQTYTTTPKMANLINSPQEISQKFHRLEKEVYTLRKQADKPRACSQSCSRMANHRSQSTTTHHHSQSRDTLLNVPPTTGEATRTKAPKEEVNYSMEFYHPPGHSDTSDPGLTISQKAGIPPTQLTSCNSRLVGLHSFLFRH